MFDRGSALLIVVISLFLITILISILLMFNYYQNIFIVKEINRTKSYYLAESGLQYSLAMLANNGYDSVGRIFKEEISSNELFNASIIPFGGYLLCKAQGKSGKEAITLRGIIANRTADYFKRSINITDPNYPLFIAGKTEIYGDVAVSNASVITGRFKGRGFEGKVPINGKVLNSDIEILPEHDLKAFELFTDSLTGLRKNVKEIIEKTTVINDANINGFRAKRTIVFGSDLHINLETEIYDLTDKYIKVNGNLYVKGKSRIKGFGIIDVAKSVEISGKSVIGDCILISIDSTVIKGNCALSNQVISGYKISVIDSATTKAPCLLLVYDHHEKRGKIELRSYAICSGAAFLLTKFSGEMKWGKNEGLPTIEIAKSAKFEGLIYSNMHVTHFGDVAGNITAKSFYFYEQPTVYLNWLVDAKVSNDPDNGNLVIPMLFNISESGLKYEYYY